MTPMALNVTAHWRGTADSGVQHRDHQRCEPAGAECFRRHLMPNSPRFKATASAEQRIPLPTTFPMRVLVIERHLLYTHPGGNASGRESFRHPGELRPAQPERHIPADRCALDSTMRSSTT